ncbi:DUF6491 family protein [Hyphococcus flavus]|uniref:DUF6491 family protein n=1 Tax=Hyphococcus flavus TaxID=1866326 RepID=A0AAE9ZD78_9PROT|nr:DUF6491 family protein [Hyphococcus flavus]WDI30483.1 DUF6491 family protein [Hyphococcus flavus]
MKTVLSLLAAASLGGLSMTAASLAGEKGKGAETDGPDYRIGEKVNRICFQRGINGWKTVKGVDNAVLLERGVNNWYYVELLGACRENTFRSALAIGIDSRPGGGCVTRGDTIIVEDGPGFNRRCSITGIYEWNEDAVAEEAEDDEETEREGD